MKYQLLTILVFFLIGCKNQSKKETVYKHTNLLIKETSPYLLQHAHNPVNWHAWNKETLDLAKKENKLLLISIGYAACHWCHVMEKESFENEEVAQLMNDNFICIKVDREERPDVDKIYIDAIQILKGNSGWPLNAVALPDGRPFWGGTYFQKENWVEVLGKISKMWQDNPKQVTGFAEELVLGIKSKRIKSLNLKKRSYNAIKLDSLLTNWKQYFDTNLGGYRQAPKFPMPTNYHFLLRFSVQNKDQQLLKYVNTTLTKMAYGGIYDHVGGGFARYATDTKWHIPHFEKMLYDNAQLVSLYADAYLITKNELYKDVVYESLDFVKNELTDKNHAFYSSLDADSLNELKENEEGAYYYWKEKELQQLIKEDFSLFKEYYNINSYGLWKKNIYVLITKEKDDDFVNTHNISLEKFKKKLGIWKKILQKARKKRVKPKLDDKVLTSWNALMAKAYIDAYRVFNDPVFLTSAQKNLEFLISKMQRKDGGLYRNFKNKQSNINAYLEDYATLIDALIAMYEVSLEEKWIQKAKELTNYTFTHFYDSEIKLFYYTSDQDHELITRNIEITDNVIPASNSIMARNLLKLGHIFADKKYIHTSEAMLNNVYDKAKAYAPSFSNWLQLAADFSGNYYEVALSGKDALTKLKEFNQYYLPNKLIVGSTKPSELPLLQNRYNEQETVFYICVNNACQMPTDQVTTAIQQIKVAF